MKGPAWIPVSTRYYDLFNFRWWFFFPHPIGTYEPKQYSQICRVNINVSVLNKNFFILPFLPLPHITYRGQYSFPQKVVVHITQNLATFHIRCWDNIFTLCNVSSLSTYSMNLLVKWQHLPQRGRTNLSEWMKSYFSNLSIPHMLGHICNEFTTLKQDEGQGGFCKGIPLLISTGTKWNHKCYTSPCPFEKNPIHFSQKIAKLPKDPWQPFMGSYLRPQTTIISSASGAAAADLKT